MNNKRNKQNMEPLIFRFFKISDTSECANFTEKKWPLANILADSKKAELLMYSYLKLSRLYSSQMEVACISNKVVGLLFGTMENDWNVRKKIKAIFASIILFIKAIFGSYGKLKNPLFLAKNIITTELKFQYKSPKYDAQVVLFIVAPNYRGQGIGKALMDRFVGLAREKQVKQISLYTDPFSNWQFYERYSFTRYSTFDNDLDSFLRKEKVQGFIYILKVRNSSN